MDITTLTEQELKALAFDEIQRRDLAVQNLQLIVEQLNKLNQKDNGTTEEDSN